MRETLQNNKHHKQTNKQTNTNKQTQTNKQHKQTNKQTNTNNTNNNNDSSFLAWLKQHAQEKSQHDLLCSGILIALLVNPQQPGDEETQFQLHFQHLIALVRDGFDFLITKTHKLLQDKFHKLNESAKLRVLRLIRELLNHKAPRIDSLLAAILRHIPGGLTYIPMHPINSHSNPNPTNPQLPPNKRTFTPPFGGVTGPTAVVVLKQIIQIIVQNNTWFYSNPRFVSIFLFHVLRLLADHMSALLIFDSPASTNISSISVLDPSTISLQHELSQLRQEETKLALEILRDHPNEWQSIGRDVIRLLQDVGKLPEFFPIWQNLTTPFASNKPMSPVPLTRHMSSSSAPASPLGQILSTPTPSIYLQSRITPEMEQQLTFLMSQVKFGNHRRYQQWFQNKHLSTPEGEALIPDLIRFVCGVHHPPNSIIASPICQRYSVVGWLLNCVKVCS